MYSDTELLGWWDIVHDLIVIGDFDTILTPNELFLIRLNNLLGLFSTGLEISLRLENVFKVLYGELKDVFGTVPYHLLWIVFQDLGQISLHLDLLRCENAHLSGISHIDDIFKMMVNFDGLFI